MFVYELEYCKGYILSISAMSYIGIKCVSHLLLHFDFQTKKNIYMTVNVKKNDIFQMLSTPLSSYYITIKVSEL